MASATARLLAQNSLCCFCGGTEAAVNMDHQPARVMFPDRHRPKGLEFPACSVCNGRPVRTKRGRIFLPVSPATIATKMPPRTRH